MKFKLTAQEKKWVLYDVGNSAFILLVTTIVPIYFNALAKSGGLDAVQYLAYWGFAASAATLLVALTGPVLGAVSDWRGRKKPMFLCAALLGIFGCVLLGFMGGWLSFLCMFVLAKLGYSLSLIFYDSMLSDVTEPARMDNVSSQGYAWGYIGSCVPFIACLAIVLTRPFGMSFQNAMQIAFVITAAWWVAFTIPMLKDVEQTHYKPREDHAVSKAFHGIGATLKKIWADKTLRHFIIAYFFYIDGVHTIIKLSTSYGSDLGIDGTQLVLALLVTQFVAFPSAIAYGKLGRKFGTKTMLLVGIAGYTFITLFAAFFLRSAVEFWFLAIMVGLFQGGIQALSRSEFGKLCPKEHANEYFGFFDIFGKYAAIMGTFIVGTMTALTGSGSLGVFSIVILFVIGFIMMRKVPDRPATQKEQ